MARRDIDLLFVLVHYRTPERLAQAVEETLAELDRSSISAQLIVVDNSGELQAVDPRCELLQPAGNLGYAGAANLGFRHHPARYKLVCNPDVTLLPGCLEKLLADIDGHAAVGPSLYWDSKLRLQLPATEPFGQRAGAAWWRGSGARSVDRERAAWRRSMRRHWQADRPFTSSQLSGACLLFDADALSAVGPLDENFRLYFEETDWLVRAARSGHTTRFVPDAQAIHTFDASARKEPRARAWFAESEALFRRRYRLLDRPKLTEHARQQSESAAAWTGRLDLDRGAQQLWFELSASPERYPAAAELLDAAAIERATGSDGSVRWNPPEEVSKRIAGWWLTATNERGEELSVFRIEA